jgi:two-component system sensor histidine kinase UhpB
MNPTPDPVSPATQPTPLDLPRLVMRRAAGVALAVLALALGLGLAGMEEDIEREMAAAKGLALTLAALPGLADLDDAQARARLQQLWAQGETRHLQLQVLDAHGQVLLGAATPARDPGRLIDGAHLRWQGAGPSAPVTWPLPRPDGSRWTVRLQVSREGERQEALANLLGMLGLLLLAVAGLLVVMRWNLRRAFAPLQPLLQAIAGIERHDTAAVRGLPPMPVRELDRVAQALRHLAQALEDGEAERRRLAQRVITLQEDERARLARELHDEFGQHLTALQVDAAWLQRRLQGDVQAQEVAAALVGHGRQLQRELRDVLARLRPLQGLDGDGGAMALDSLLDLLRSLLQGWASGPRAPLSLTMSFLAAEEDGRPAAPPGPGAVLPTAVALALYRITQEALTNAARHAEGAAVEVQLVWEHAAGGGGAIEWQVSDDGPGLAGAELPLLRGSGLAGIRERVWALGGELKVAPARPDAAVAGAAPGLRLSARLAWPPGPAG